MLPDLGMRTDSWAEELATYRIHIVSVEVGWPTGLEPVTFGATIRCSAD